jgi:hypothetical protein
MTTKEPRTPAQLADDAAEAIRSLNHATMSARDGWVYPGDAYSTVAGLAAMARMLPQALVQMGRFMDALEETGRLTSDHGQADLPGRLEAFHGAMRNAEDHARILGRALDRAHQSLGPVAYKE